MKSELAVCKDTRKRNLPGRAAKSPKFLAPTGRQVTMDNSSKPAAKKPVIQKQKKLDFSGGKLKVGKDDAEVERLITEAEALIPRVYALHAPGFDAKGVEVSTRDTVSSTSSHSLWKLDLFVSSQVDLLHGQVEQDGQGEVGEGRVRPHGPAQGQAGEPAGLGSRAWPSRSCRL